MQRFRQRSQRLERMRLRRSPIGHWRRTSSPRSTNKRISTTPWAAWLRCAARSAPIWRSGSASGSASLTSTASLPRPAPPWERWASCGPAKASRDPAGSALARGRIFWACTSRSGETQTTMTPTTTGSGRSEETCSDRSASGCRARSACSLSAGLEGFLSSPTLAEAGRAPASIPRARLVFELGVVSRF